MSQRTVTVDKEYSITLTVKVRLKSFSNHDGYFDGQVDLAIKEFSEEIEKELLYKLEGEYVTYKIGA